jgi:pimeloyl-ACP methyl ester carboxylesterase
VEIEVVMSYASTLQKSEATQSARLEIVSRLPAKPRAATPIVFVHGAWHAAWCWEDNFLNYFSDLGFACYAVNLRGHGASLGTRDVRFVRIRHYVEDLTEAVASIGGNPILVGHSLGGFVVQKYLEKSQARLGVLMASIPPTGAFRMLKKIMASQPKDLLVANLMFSLKPLFSTSEKVRNSLFSSSTPDDIVEQCTARLQDDVIIGFLDYLFLNLVDTSKISTKVLTFGAAEDHMIDKVDLDVTGRAYGRAPVIIPELGHDMMIDRHWERAAQAIALDIEAHLDSNRSSRLARVA